MESKQRLPLLEDLSQFLGGLRGKRILVRVDFNSPVDPKTGRLLDIFRIEAHLPTIRELIESGASIVLISHQGKPGSDDFVCLEEHAKVLSSLLGQEVIFIDDVIGPAARKAIQSLKPGEVLLLDNTRLLSEEVIEAPPEKHVNSIFVKKLAPLFDGFVNDAFATAHRSQPSIVGFPLKLPSAAGRLMQKEVEVVQRIMCLAGRPRVFILGGGKVADAIKILAKLLEREVADKVLTGGLLALALLKAKGFDVGECIEKILASMPPSLMKLARELASDERVVLPKDLVVEKQNGCIKEVKVGDSICGCVKDVGSETVSEYVEYVKEAKTIVLRGPLGVIEDVRFRKATEEVIKASFTSNAFVIVGGGHMVSVARRVVRSLKIPPERYHFSSAGGALLLYMSGEKLPGIEALKLSAKMFYGW